MTCSDRDHEWCAKTDDGEVSMYCRLCGAVPVAPIPESERISEVPLEAPVEAPVEIQTTSDEPSESEERL